MAKIFKKDPHLINPGFLAQNLNDATFFTATEARFNRVLAPQGPAIIPFENLPDVDTVVDQPLDSIRNISGFLTAISDYLKEILQLSERFSKGKLPEASLKSIQEDVDWRLRSINIRLSKISVICNENVDLKNWWKDASISKIIDLDSLGLKNLDFLGPQGVKLIDKNYFNINGITQNEVYVRGFEQSNITLALDKYDRIYLRAEPKDNSFLTPGSNEAKYFLADILKKKWILEYGSLLDVPGDKMNVKFGIANNRWSITINLKRSVKNVESWAREATENPMKLVEAALKRVLQTWRVIWKISKSLYDDQSARDIDVV